MCCLGSRFKIESPKLTVKHIMCYTDTLASLQAAVLEGVKIDSSDKTDNTTMQAIESHITEFVNNVANHNPEALTAFKQLEVFVAEQRRLLTSNVASAKKHTEAEERRAEVNRKAEAKRIEKEAAAADGKKPVPVAAKPVVPEPQPVVVESRSEAEALAEEVRPSPRSTRPLKAWQSPHRA